MWVLCLPEAPAELVRVVDEHAEGNPLFIEEVIAALVERDAVIRDSGHVRIRHDVAVDVPGTVQDIIRARIDRLDEPIKRTLQTAAIIGREFTLRILHHVSEDTNDLHRHLEALKRLELVHEKRVFPETAYSFKHAVTQEVAYQTLLTSRRQAVHALIGSAMEDLYTDQLDEQAAVLAHHFSRSDRIDKAIRYALRAGDRATGLYANVEAAVHYELALALARDHAVTPDAARWRIDAAIKLAAVGITRQDLERNEKNLQAAHELAESLGDDARLAAVLYWLGRLHYVRFEPRRAIEYSGRSLEIADRLRDEALAAPAVNLMGRAAWAISDFARSADLMERSVEQMRRLGNKAEESTAAGFVAWVCGLMGDFDRAVRYAELGIAVAREIGNPFAEAAALMMRGFVDGQRGEWSQSLAEFTAATVAAQRAGDLFRVYLVKFNAGRIHIMAGDPATGRAVLEESIELADRIGTKFGLAWQKPSSPNLCWLQANWIAPGRSAMRRFVPPRRPVIAGSRRRRTESWLTPRSLRASPAGKKPGS